MSPNESPTDYSVLSHLPFPPTFAWRKMGESEHVVQFYEHDAFLLDTLSGFIGAGLRAGEGCLVVATKPHRESLEDRLTAYGLDLTLARTQHQYLALDAAETLAAFMVDGTPDQQRFTAVVGSLVARLAERHRRVRIFGEMVALLWAEGNGAAATRLEELWNALRKTHPFSLFCAYPMRGFRGVAHADAFAEICMQHSQVIPTERFMDLPSQDARLRSIAQLEQKAASLEAEIAVRQNVEEALAGRERELTDFLENAAVGLHQMGPDGTILWANGAELDLLGYAPDEYVGHHVAEFHLDRDIVEKMLTTLRRGERLSGYPARLRCKDGSIKDVLLHANALLEGGRFIHSRCFTIDVTDRKRAEEAMGHLAAIVASSHDAIVSTDLQGIIRSWNKGAERLFGYTAVEMIGQPVWLYIPSDRQDEEPAILDRIRRGERIEHYETVRRRKDGRDIDVSLTVSPILDGMGRVIGASKIARDITERKRAEQEIRRLNEELKQKVEAYARAIRDLERSRAELNEKIRDLELFHDVAVGRELKLIVLEREVAALRRQMAERATENSKRSSP